MLPLILILAQLFGHVQAQNSTSNPLQTWQLDDVSRSSWDILWTCLTTISACTWAVLHFALPIYIKGSTRAWIKFRTWLLTLIGPEIIIIDVAIDVYCAREIKVQGNKAFRATLGETKSEESRSNKERTIACDADCHGREKHREWTMTHGFCVSMSGFQLRTNDGWLYTISGKNIIPLIEAGIVRPCDLDEEEIKDRAKADAVAKILAILQSLWITINILARAAYNLPISPLEISTVAYVLCALFIYALWWYKPKDMETPITLHIPHNRDSEEISSWVHDILDLRPYLWRHPTKQIVDEEIKNARDPKEPMLRRPRHILWTNQINQALIGDKLSPLNEAILTTCAIVAVQVVSAIHLAAWNFIFPTSAERWAWRIFSLIGIIIPWVSFWIAIVPLSLAWAVRHFDVHLRWLGSYIDPESRRTLLEGAVFEAAFNIYYVSRVGIIILMFVSLRALPAGSFVGIDWLSSIPHI